MTTAVYEAPGTRYTAEAFGKSSWISSRATYCHGVGGSREMPYKQPITHAIASRNSFGYVGFDFFLSQEEAEAEMVRRASWDIEQQIVAVSSRPETAEEV